MEYIPGTSSGISFSTDIRIENLFDSRRLHGRNKYLKVILYFPFGVLIILIRLFTGIVGLLILSLLPRTSNIRSLIFKSLCRVLGAVVEFDDKYLDDDAKILVANHVCIFDRIAMNLIVPCNTITKGFQVKDRHEGFFWKDADISYSRELSNDDILALKICIEGSPVRVLNFPEGATTNGKFGLMKFHPGVFSLNLAVQPVLIHVSVSSFISISQSVLGSSVWSDIFWVLFLPCTHFTVKILPSMVKMPEESALDFSKRVQQLMATCLGLFSTAVTSTDKIEFLKKLQTSSSFLASPRTSSKSSIPSPFLSPSMLFTEDLISSEDQAKLSLNTAAETFGKTSKERMLSYQERKAMLMKAAKMKYLIKCNME